jgi:hypothetical protein
MEQAFPWKALSPQYALAHGTVHKSLQYRVLGQWF